MEQKLLPIGIHTFEQIRERNCIYVDKTEMIHSLLQKGSVYFLSRPRRFGKSLLLDTIHQLMRGRRELFEGLWVEDKWDWDVVYPVVRFDFGSGVVHTKEELDSKISFHLRNTAEKYQITMKPDVLSSQFAQLLIDLEAKYNQKVVVLVDEYDKPILDNFTNPEISEIMRDGLRDIYSVMKAQQESLRFVFLTGVSKFAKVSVFSGLNNLQDISLNPKYATICGYTQTNIEHDFVDWLDGVNLEQLKQWYNGYNFLGEKVYNPFDVLLYLESKQLKNYWFETGTPDFLVKLLKKSQFSLPELENLYSTDDLMNRFDVNNLVLEGFFFQTGYLTIKEVLTSPDGGLDFLLGFPNLEVKKSLSSLMLQFSSPSRFQYPLKQKIVQALLDGKPEVLEDPLKQFFASIPYNWFVKNEMDKYEGYWASLIYSMLVMVGVHLVAEDTSNRGRLDLCLSHENHFFLIEFKMTSNNEDPIEQIKSKGYAEKYKKEGVRIWAVGITFDKEVRNISKFQYEELLD